MQIKVKNKSMDILDCTMIFEVSSVKLPVARLQAPGFQLKRKIQAIMLLDIDFKCRYLNFNKFSTNPANK